MKIHGWWYLGGWWIVNHMTIFFSQSWFRDIYKTHICWCKTVTLCCLNVEIRILHLVQISERLTLMIHLILLDLACWRCCDYWLEIFLIYDIYRFFSLICSPCWRSALHSLWSSDQAWCLRNRVLNQLLKFVLVRIRALIPPVILTPLDCTFNLFLSMGFFHLFSWQSSFHDSYRSYCGCS